MSPVIQKHWLISGVVQGVGFRVSTRRKAKTLGIVGWVKNTADGSVEIVAEGDMAAMQRFEQWCREGPSHAVVSEVKTLSEKSTSSPTFSSFEIRHS